MGACGMAGVMVVAADSRCGAQAVVEGDFLGVRRTLDAIGVAEDSDDGVGIALTQRRVFHVHLFKTQAYGKGEWFGQNKDRFRLQIPAGPVKIGLPGTIGNGCSLIPLFVKILCEKRSMKKVPSGVEIFKARIDTGEPFGQLVVVTEQADMHHVGTSNGRGGLNLGAPALAGMVEKLGNGDVEFHRTALSHQEDANPIGCGAPHNVGLDGAQVELLSNFLRQFIELRGVEARADKACHALFERLRKSRLRLSGHFNTFYGVAGIDVVFGEKMNLRLLAAPDVLWKKESSPGDERA
jgi:hypothetical protein